MTFAVQNAIPHVDELVREYLVFRGFPKALAAFDSDKRTDRLKGFQVSKVVEALMSCVHSHSADQLEELWGYLESRFFIRPSEPSLAAAVRKMRLSLRRFYLIYAVTNQRIDKVTEYFGLYGNELYTDPEWKNWFALPFVKNPEADDVFAPYFQKQWSEIFAQSLHNFLSSVFQNMALPRVLNFNLERLKRKQMESEIEYLHNEVQRLTKELDEANATISSLSRQRGRSTEGNNGARDSVSGQVVTPMLLKHVSSDSIERAKKKLGEEEMKLNTARKKWADETLQSSIRSTDRETIEVVHSPDTGEETWAPVFGSRRAKAHKRVPQVIHQEVFTGHSTPISRCRFSSSGDYVASASTDGTLRIWSLESQQGAGADDTKNATIFCFTEILSLAWETKSDRLLFCGTADGRVKLWNPNNVAIGEISTDVDYPRLLDIACSPSDSAFATAAVSSDGSEGVFYLYNFKTLQLERKVRLEAPVTSLHFNHNGSLLAAAGRDGVVRVYDMSTNYSPIMQWKADESELSCVRFSRDETAIYTLGTDNKINEWGIHNIGKKVHTYDWEDRCSSDMAFDWEGTHFVVGGKTSAHVYSEGESVPLAKLSGHSKPVTTVDWHPTNNTIVTGSLDASVRIVTLA